jgi:hypothetical protein
LRACPQDTAGSDCALGTIDTDVIVSGELHERLDEPARFTRALIFAFGRDFVWAKRRSFFGLWILVLVLFFFLVIIAGGETVLQDRIEVCFNLVVVVLVVVLVTGLGGRSGTIFFLFVLFVLVGNLACLDVVAVLEIEIFFVEIVLVQIVRDDLFCVGIDVELFF